MPPVPYGVGTGGLAIMGKNRSTVDVLNFPHSRILNTITFVYFLATQVGYGSQRGGSLSATCDRLGTRRRDTTAQRRHRTVSDADFVACQRETARSLAAARLP